MRKPSPLVVLAMLTWAGSAHAKPGTHAPAISTFDTRASSVALAYRHGFVSGGGLDVLSYNANFTSTTGRLNAQFGIHYLNLRESGEDSAAHGIGGSAVALYVLSASERFDDGTPKVALSGYSGGVPTALLNGQRQYLTLPWVAGLGLSLSPARALTITPWFEAALSFNLDSSFHAADIKLDPTTVVDPVTGEVHVTEAQVRDVVTQGVDFDSSVSVPMRIGLDVAIHVGEGFDFDLGASYASFGGAFGGTGAATLGAALVWRWDNIVPAVLPPARRLEHEDCGAVEERFLACPNSRGWVRRPLAAPPAPGPAPYPQQPYPPPYPQQPYSPPQQPAPAKPPAPAAPVAPGQPPSAGFPDTPPR